jgi:hypothetical protein
MTIKISDSKEPPVIEGVGEICQKKSKVQFAPEIAINIIKSNSPDENK